MSTLDDLEIAERAKSVVADRLAELEYAVEFRQTIIAALEVRNREQQDTIAKYEAELRSQADRIEALQATIETYRGLCGIGIGEPAPGKPEAPEEL